MSTLRNLISSLAFLATPLAVNAAYWSPHVGADYKYWGMHAYHEFYPLFPRVNNAFDLYFGTRINGLFGIDIGYDQSENKTKTYVFDGDEVIFNPTGIDLAGDSTMIDMRLRSFYGNINFYWQIYRDFELIFTAGVAHLYPKSHIQFFDGDWAELPIKVNTFWSGRYGFGAQYNPIPCLGIKGTVSFEQTRRISYISLDKAVFRNREIQPLEIHPYQRSSSFTLGFVYSFSPPRRDDCCG